MKTRISFATRTKIILGLLVSVSLSLAAHGAVQFAIASTSDFMTSLPMPSPTTEVAMDGQYSYIADEAGLSIIDLANPSLAVLKGSVNATAPSLDVDVSGSTVYTVNGSAGLTAYSVADPAHPTRTYVLNTPGTATGFFPFGSKGYVADGVQGLTVIDLTNRVVQNTFNTPGNSLDVVVKGDYAYIADNTNGVVIMNRTNGLIVKTLKLPSSVQATKVVLKDNRLYVLGKGYGVYVYDISLPLRTTLKASIALDRSQDLQDLTVDGNNVFASVYEAGINSWYYIIDAYSLSNVTIRQEAVQLYGLGIGAKNSTVVVANGVNGVTVRALEY